MRKFLIAMIALFAVGAMQAQTARLGVRAAYELSSAGSNDTFENGSGFNAGAFYNIPIAQSVYFEPGLSFFYDVFKVDVPLFGGESVRNYGLRLPLNFGYTFNFTPDLSLALYTGPQINYGMSLKLYKNGTKFSDLYDTDNYNHFDCQWGFGARFIYKQSMFAEIGGAAGLTDMQNDNYDFKQKMHRNNFTVGVGYIF